MKIGTSRGLCPLGSLLATGLLLIPKDTSYNWMLYVFGVIQSCFEFELKYLLSQQVQTHDQQFIYRFQRVKKSVYLLLLAYVRGHSVSNHFPYIKIVAAEVYS